MQPAADRVHPFQGCSRHCRLGYPGLTFLAGHSGMFPCFLGGSVCALGAQRPQRPDDVRCGCTTAGSPSRRSRARPRCRGWRACPRTRVTSSLALASASSPASASSLAVEDVHRALRAHDRDLRGRPGEVDVGAEVLGAHDVVGAAVRLAGDDGDLAARSPRRRRR